MGDLIQIRDHQSKRQREQAEAALREMTLEQQAIEIMTFALMGAPTLPGQEPVYHIDIPDNSPSEMNPDKDSA